MENSSSGNKVTFLNQIMPLQVIPLLLALFAVIPITTYSVSSIKSSIIIWFDNILSTFKPENLEAHLSLPTIPIHFFVIAIVGFVFCCLIVAAIQTIYIKNWFLSVDKKNFYYPQPFFKILFSLVNWSIYRFFFVFHPILVMGILSFLLLFATINFFNVIAFIMGINLDLVLILGIFIGSCVAFFWVVAVIMSGWYLITSVFGNIVSVSEPFSKIDLIRKRSRRLSFLSFGVIFTYIFYLFLIITILAEILILIVHNYQFVFKDMVLYVIGFIMTFVAYILIGRSLAIAYYKSVLIQYAKIALKKNNITHAQHQSFDLNNSPLSK